jgi:hypothetical protein
LSLQTVSTWHMTKELAKSDLDPVMTGLKPICCW